MATKAQTQEEPEQAAEPVVEVDPEAVKQAEEALARNNQKASASEAGNDFSKPRVKKGVAAKMAPDYDMLVADYAPNLNYEEFGPTAFAATGVGKRTGSTRTQEFILDEEKVLYLHFQPPGQNLPKKRLYTIKAFHKDGRLVQLPFELQIQNTAGGDMEDAIGIRRYQRKGLAILVYDQATLMPIYCPAWGCFAKGNPNIGGFCSPRHAVHTLPNRYKESGVDGLDVARGLFESGATTERVWSA